MEIGNSSKLNYKNIGCHAFYQIN